MHLFQNSKSKDSKLGTYYYTQQEAIDLLWSLTNEKLHQTENGHNNSSWAYYLRYQCPRTVKRKWKMVGIKNTGGIAQLYLPNYLDDRVNLEKKQIAGTTPFLFSLAYLEHDYKTWNKWGNGRLGQTAWLDIRLWKLIYESTQFRLNSFKRAEMKMYIMMTSTLLAL